MEDSQIVALYIKRNEQAIAETAAKYGKYCFHIASNILGNPQDAEETVNDAYIGVWNAIPPHMPAVLATFVGKITRRIAIKRWQEGRVQKRGGGETALVLEELSDYISGRESPETELETAELRRALNRFVQRLPQPERSVFVCRYWYLDPVADIAARFGFSQSKVKSMLSRTRKKLYAYLKKEGIDL